MLDSRSDASCQVAVDLSTQRPIENQDSSLHTVPHFFASNPVDYDLEQYKRLFKLQVGR